MEDLDSNWEELLSRLKAEPRDQDAWEELYSRLVGYGNQVTGQSHGVHLDLPEDLAQETILKLLESQGSIEGLRNQPAPGRYLRKSVENLSRDQWRRKVLAIKVLQAISRGPATSLPSSDQAPGVGLGTWARGLSIDEQSLLRMRIIEDLSLKEISKKLNIGYPATAVRVFRLMNKLRKRRFRDFGHKGE